MKLSVFMVTKDSARYVEEVLRVSKTFADEIVVAVDSSSSDDTEKICGRYADVLYRIEPIGYAAPALSWLHRQCSGDWVLRLDDDELPSQGLIDALPRLMNDREITHYWTRVRWMFGESGERWISDRPWWPSWILRLHRNIPSIFHVPNVVHTRVHVEGGAGYIYDGSIYHYDLVHHSEKWRRHKAEQRYERRAPGQGLGHYYTPEDASPNTLPVPPDDPPAKVPESSRKARARNLLRKRISPKSPDRIITLDEIMRAGMQDFERNEELFRASLEVLDSPEEMRVDEWLPVDVRLRNESSIVWPLPGLGQPRVRVGYHWLKADGEYYLFGGHRTDVPNTLWPEQEIRFPCSVNAPSEPGDYILQWDIAIEDVDWFSNVGWEGKSLWVRVG